MWRWWSGNEEFPLIKSRKAWMNMNFISIENTKCNLEILKTFLCFKNTRKYWIILGKYMFVNMGLNCFWTFSKMYVLCTRLFVCFYCFYWKMSTCFFYGGADREMIHFPFMKSRKAWIWISYLSKNTTCTFGKSWKLFYFQGRESSNIN